MSNHYTVHLKLILIVHCNWKKKCKGAFVDASISVVPVFTNEKCIVEGSYMGKQIIKYKVVLIST